MKAAVVTAFRAPLEIVELHHLPDRGGGEPLARRGSGCHHGRGAASRPPVADVVPSSRPKRAPGSAFGPMAERWADEYYGELHRGQADREQTVRGHLQRLTAFMADRGLVIETVVRDQVKALQASVTRTPVTAPAVAVPHGLVPEDLVTMQQAVKLPGMASRGSTSRSACSPVTRRLLSRRTEKA
jgi:hypothetical protein